jgi:hypothetical protein
MNILREKGNEKDRAEATTGKEGDHRRDFEAAAKKRKADAHFARASL